MIAGVGLAILRWFISTQIGQVVGLTLLALAAFGGWTWKVQRDADKAAVERVLKETKDESDRRMKALTEVAKIAGERSVEIEKLAADRAELLGRIEVLSKANDGVACLDTGAIKRLMGISKSPNRQ